MTFNEILKDGVLETTRKDLNKKYLVDPFFKSIHNPKFKVMTAPTGFGKTWSIWNEISPRYLKEFGDLHIHVAPHLETIDRDEIMGYLKGVDLPNLYVIHNEDNLDFKEVRDALLEGYKVVVTLTDAAMRFLIGDKHRRLIQLIEDYKGSVLLTRDELSYGTTSTAENYEFNIGYKSKKHKGTYIRNLFTLYKAGANTYGFTATPTREQTHDIQSIYGKSIEIVNTWPDKQEMFLFQKWYENLEVSPYTMEEYDDDTILKDEIEFISNEIQTREFKLNRILNEVGMVEEDTKFTGIITLQSEYIDSKVERMTVDRFLRMVKRYPNMINRKYTFIITTFKGWKEYDHGGNETGNSGVSNEWLDMMNDQTTSTRFTVVIYKGNYGINIPSLCVGVSMRSPKTWAKDIRTTIRLSGLQFLGRLNRTNMFSGGWETFKHIYKNFGVETGMEYLMIKNTFVFKGPDSSSGYWEDAFYDFDEKYGTSYSRAMGYLYEG